MRVISMQSPEVWKILQSEGVYHASLDKCREAQDYKEDMKNLGGAVPIWCWAYPELNFYTMYSGETLEYLRCEMSLQQGNCWDPFVMLELEIPRESLHIGKAHNACMFSCVFAELTLGMVQAVYTVRDNPDSEYGWYFKIITPIWVREGAEVITREVLDCQYWDSQEETYKGCFQQAEPAKCLYCERVVPYVFEGKHFCSLAHLWKHKQRFIESCSTHGVQHSKALALYKLYKDSDFQEDVVDKLGECAAMRGKDFTTDMRDTAAAVYARFKQAGNYAPATYGDYGNLHDGCYAKCPHCGTLTGGYEHKNLKIQVDARTYRCENCGKFFTHD